MASAPPPILHHCAGSGSARWLPRSLIAGLAAVWSKAPALAPFDGWGGVTIGTITFAAAASTPPFSFAGEIAFAGDRLTVLAPGTQDASLADISITFKGTRT
jgi:hypothetical protein